MKKSKGGIAMKKWVGWLCICVLMLALVGCGSEKKSETAVLKIGSNATFVPFEFTGEDQKLTGYDIELVTALAKDMGMEPEFHNIAFDGLIPALNTKQIDISISGMTITPARAEKVEFSLPYYESGLGVLMANGQEVTKPEDLVGKQIAVQLGTTGVEYASQHIPGVQLRTFDHNSEALLEMKKGGAEAVIGDLPVLQYYLSTHTDTKAKLSILPIEKPEYFGIAMAKGNTEMKAKVDKALQHLQENGTLDKLYEKYFHQKAPKLPGLHS